MLGAQEALGHRVVEERREAVVEAAHVQQPAGLAVHPELRPGDDLEELLEGAQPAGQREEAVGQVGHQRLALVHRVDGAQVGQAEVGDLALEQRLRDDAGDLAAGLEHRVGQRAHQPDARAAVDQADAAPGQQLAELAARRPRRPGRRPGDEPQNTHRRRMRRAQPRSVSSARTATTPASIVDRQSRSGSPSIRSAMPSPRPKRISATAAGLGAQAQDALGLLGREQPGDVVARPRARARPTRRRCRRCGATA